MSDLGFDNLMNFTVLSFDMCRNLDSVALNILYATVL